MILVIDNYDSFTYNLVQYLGELGETVEVYRNDQIDIELAESKNPERIVISPGPGVPDGAGVTLKFINHFEEKLPILGVCLGHQAITQAFGGKIIRAKELMHGKTSNVLHKGTGIFKDLPNPLVATRYHSLIAEREGFPECLEVIAWLEDETIMGITHKDYPHIYGVQFHPESVLTEAGHKLLSNFLEIAHAT